MSSTAARVSGDAAALLCDCHAAHVRLTSACKTSSGQWCVAPTVKAVGPTFVRASARV